MRKIMYKNIVGIIEDEKFENEYCGKLLTDTVACFYGETESELIKDFKQVVNDYLEYCQSENQKPEKVELITA